MWRTLRILLRVLFGAAGVVAVLYFFGVIRTPRPMFHNAFVHAGSHDHALLPGWGYAESYINDRGEAIFVDTEDNIILIVAVGKTGFMNWTRVRTASSQSRILLDLADGQRRIITIARKPGTLFAVKPDGTLISVGLIGGAAETRRKHMRTADPLGSHFMADVVPYVVPGDAPTFDRFTSDYVAPPGLREQRESEGDTDVTHQ